MLTKINDITDKLLIFQGRADDSSDSEKEPCLEKFSDIEFQMNAKTENALFGPLNNRYKKTMDDLIAEIDWLKPKIEIDWTLSEQAKADAQKHNVEQEKYYDAIEKFEKHKEDKMNT